MVEPENMFIMASGIGPLAVDIGNMDPPTVDIGTALLMLVMVGSTSPGDNTSKQLAAGGDDCSPAALALPPVISSRVGASCDGGANLGRLAGLDFAVLKDS